MKLVLLDLDHTIFDTNSFRKAIFNNIAKLVEKKDLENTIQIAQDICSQIITKRGYFDASEFVKQFSKKFNRENLADIVKKSLISKKVMQNSLFADVIPSLKELKKLGKIGILSQGEDPYQRAKLTSFEEFLHPDFIFIAKDKKSVMKTIFGNLEYKTFFVDDTLNMLYQAYLINKNVVTIWMMRGDRWESKNKIPEFVPFYKVSNLKEVIKLIKN